MQLDPEIMAMLDSMPQEDIDRATTQPKLDEDILESLDRADDDQEARKQYLRDKYVWGLVAPLSGTRETYSKKLVDEVTDPGERQWVVGEVARVARVQEWAERKDYNDAGYFSRFGQRAQKVGGSFAEAGTGMLGAADDLLDFMNGRTDSADDVKFLRALESAKQQENPYIPEDIGLAGKAATGAAGMVPDLAAGLAAATAGGPVSMMGYWTARGFGERREDYLELGMGHEAASLAGLGTAGAEGAIELLNIDPTGLTGKLAAPLKAGLRTGAKEAVKKVLGKAAGEVTEKVLKHPAARRVLGETLAATKRTGLEVTEEALQGATQEAGKYLAGEFHPAVDPRPATDILTSAYGQAKDSLPGLAVLGGVGGTVQAGQQVGRYKKFVEGSANAKVNNAILDYANEGRVPSRKTWAEWGMPKKDGESRRQRRTATNLLSDQIRAHEQVKAAITGIIPTKEQWNRIGLPKEDGWTHESRKAYLGSKFAVQPASRVPDSPAAEKAAEAEAAGAPSAQVSQPLGAASAPDATTEQAAAGQAPMHPDFPMLAEGTGERVSARETVRKLEGIWGIPLRRGRIRGKKVRGIFKPFSEVARLARGEESSVAVAAHEIIGHHLDNSTDVLKSAPEDARAELGALDYDQSKKREKEGFAEFVRAYLTGAIETQKGGIGLSKAAPRFLEHFKGWLEKNPEYADKMAASRAPVEALIRAGAVGRVKGQVSQTGVEAPLPQTLGERIESWTEYLYSRIKEEGRPVMRFTKAAKKRGYDPGKGTTPFDDYNALRQIGPHFAANAIEHGVFRLGGNMEKMGPSMKEVLAPIEPGEDYENFVAYAYARHSIESWSKGKNPGITLDDAHEAVRRLGNPRYETAADGITKFNAALIGVLVDVGAVDVETAKRILAEYPTYIPLERAMPGKRTAAQAGRKMVDLGAAIHGRRGSGLQIVDPVETTLARAVRIYERAATQYVTNNLIRVAESTQGLGGWVESVPADMLATKFSFDEIKSQVAGPMQESLGMSKDEAYELLDTIDPMSALTIWRPNLAKVNGVPIVRVMRNGVPEFFQMRPELAEALGGLQTMTAPGFASKMAQSATGLLKMGATRLNLNFIASNALRDYQTYLMQGEAGLEGAFEPARWAMAYVYSELDAAAGGKGNPVVKTFQQFGGELSSFIGLDRTRIKRSKARTLLGKQSKIDTAVSMAGFTEMGPRIAEFALNLEKEGWLDRVRNGETPPMPVLIKAINQAHDVTTDFRRMGPWGRYANYFLPFLNARMEGFDKFVRTFKDHPARSSMRAAMYIVPRAMLYWWLRHDDDDYKERPRWQDAFLIFKDENGNPTWRIPRSQEWGMIGNGVERMMDALFDKDPDAISDWFKSSLETINPLGGPAGVTPIFETMFNYDSFRDRPIVSQELQSYEAPDQFYDYTSAMSKKTAEFLSNISGGRVSLSPAKMDHLANGLTGGLFGNVNNPIEKIASGGEWAANEVPGLKGVTLRKDYPKSIGDFYNEKERIDKAAKSAVKHGREEVNRVKRRRFEYASGLMSDMRKAALELPQDEKNEMDLALAGLARAALDREPLERYPNPIANLESLPESIQATVRSHVASKAITAASKRRSATAVAAEEYLRTMGVDADSAAISAYIKLRTQGVGAETAKEKADRIRRIFF